MGQKVLEQTVIATNCGGREIHVVVHSDGSVVITGARTVQVVNQSSKMLYEIERAAPNSAIAVIVSCSADSIEAEMTRFGAPWMEAQKAPKMWAGFYPISIGEIKFHLSETPEPVPIASSKKAEM